PRGVVEQRQQLAAVVGLRRLDHVGDVVGRQQSQPGPRLLRRGGQEQLRLITCREALDEVLGLAPREQTEPLETLGRGEHGPGVLQVVCAEELLLRSAPRARLGAHGSVLLPPRSAEGRGAGPRSVVMKTAWAVATHTFGLPNADHFMRPGWTRSA